VLFQEPERVKVGQTDSGLIEIEIKLRKFHLWVSEADGFTRFEVSSLVSSIMDESGEPTDYGARVRMNMLTEVWAPLFACSRGDVPTKEQFLSLPESDLSFWVKIAKELGHEFRWLDDLNDFVSSAGSNGKNEKKSGRKPAG